MVFMQKDVNLDDFIFVDLTHPLSPDVPHWGIDVGFKYNARLIQSQESAGKVKFRVQRLEMSAGIGTHMDAEKKRGLDVGADAYIVKNEFESGALLDIVSQLV